jgi:hypothetical protein
MKTDHSQGRIGGAILAFLLLFGTGVVVSTTAQAQNRDSRYPNGDQNQRDRNWDRYGSYGGSSELRQTALNAGYNEGINDGRKDRDRGRSTNYRNQSAYQKATKDYSSRLGDRELYRRYFREGYENGYNAAGYAQDNQNRDDRDVNVKQNRRGRNWDRYGTFGGSPELRQTALNAGFNEGIKQGRDDRNKRNSSGFRDRSAYQKATKDYSSGLGDRELYRRYYREGYENGYDAGYSGY